MLNQNRRVDVENLACPVKTFLVSGPKMRAAVSKV